MACNSYVKKSNITSDYNLVCTVLNQLCAVILKSNYSLTANPDTTLWLDWSESGVPVIYDTAHHLILSDDFVYSIYGYLRFKVLDLSYGRRKIKIFASAAELIFLEPDDLLFAN